MQLEALVGFHQLVVGGTALVARDAEVHIVQLVGGVAKRRCLGCGVFRFLELALAFGLLLSLGGIGGARGDVGLGGHDARQGCLGQPAQQCHLRVEACVRTLRLCRGGGA